VQAQQQILQEVLSHTQVVEVEVLLTVVVTLVELEETVEQVAVAEEEIHQVVKQEQQEQLTQAVVVAEVVIHLHQDHH
jgi:hypothetical protein